MIYKDFQNLKLSALGMGAMRLPVIDGDDAVIDEAAVNEFLEHNNLFKERTCAL